MRLSFEQEGVDLLIEDESFDSVEVGQLVPEHTVSYE
jgi:hypothetical protein